MDTSETTDKITAKASTSNTGNEVPWSGCFVFVVLMY